MNCPNCKDKPITTMYARPYGKTGGGAVTVPFYYCFNCCHVFKAELQDLGDRDSTPRLR